MSHTTSQTLKSIVLQRGLINDSQKLCLNFLIITLVADSYFHLCTGIDNDGDDIESFDYL